METTTNDVTATEHYSTWIQLPMDVITTQHLSTTDTTTNGHYCYKNITAN